MIFALLLGNIGYTFYTIDHLSQLQSVLVNIMVCPNLYVSS